MKTLDEVIEAIEVCRDSYVAGKIIKADALYYLKEYQKIEDEYDELKDWWAEEHAENVPLSWDELKAMEGKPVWVEVDGYVGYWSIVRMLTPDVFSRYYAWLKSPEDPMEAPVAELNSENYGKTWQAYRKEMK